MIIDTVLGCVVGICLGGLVVLSISTRRMKHRIENAKRLERMKVEKEMEDTEMYKRSNKSGKECGRGCTWHPPLSMMPCRNQARCVNYKKLRGYESMDCGNLYDIVLHVSGEKVCKNHAQINPPPNYNITDTFIVEDRRRANNMCIMRTIMNHYNNNVKYKLSLDGMIGVERILLYSRDRIRSYDVDMIREADNMFNTLIHFANCASFDPGRDYQGVEEREICRFANKIQMIVSEANQ